jgi:hypothetical protein
MHCVVCFFVLARAVEGGHRAIVYSRLSGIQPETFEEGLRFVIPWLQRPIIYDVRTRPKLINTTSGSKGQSPVAIGVALRVCQECNAGIDEPLGVLVACGDAQICKWCKSPSVCCSSRTAASCQKSTGSWTWVRNIAED